MKTLSNFMQGASAGLRWTERARDDFFAEISAVVDRRSGHAGRAGTRGNGGTSDFTEYRCWFELFSSKFGWVRTEKMVHAYKVVLNGPDGFERRSINTMLLMAQSKAGVHVGELLSVAEQDRFIRCGRRMNGVRWKVPGCTKRQ